VIGVPSVLIVDDHAGIRHLLTTLIRADGRLTVVGEAVDGREAVELAQRLRPDAVVLDQEMPEMTGIEAVPGLLATGAVIVMYSSGPRPDTRRLALEAGVHVYFEKGTPPISIIQQIVELLDAR
jgi:two-component system chemotaxis response regulator CheB